MEVRAQIKYVRISPIKVRFLVDSLKRMSAQVALDHLGLSQLRTAKVLYKAIQSAVSNGKMLPGFDPKKAQFKTLMIDEGPVLKRYRAGSRGMARPYVRKSSHITVVLEQKGLEMTKKEQKTAPKIVKQADVQASVAETQVQKVEKTLKVAKPKKVQAKAVISRQRTTNK